jgi:hypothetical protein
MRMRWSVRQAWERSAHKVQSENLKKGEHAEALGLDGR